MILRHLIIFLVLLSATTAAVYAQQPINWTPSQLMQPAELAMKIKKEKDIPVILSVGPGVYIPHSIDIGPAEGDEALNKLKSQLSSYKKNTPIVIYCGCCPFERCPNVRPAIDALKTLHFTNYYLLNLKTNIKTDWINKGYPVVQ